MSVVAGDLIEITWNHPSLGSGTFFGKSNEDSNFDTGGFRSNDDANMIDGGGRMIDQMNLTRWSTSLTISSDLNITEEINKLSNLASSPVPADYTFSHVSGTVWAGNGKPVGDVQSSNNAGTIQIKFAGSGRLTKIVG